MNLAPALTHPRPRPTESFGPHGTHAVRRIEARRSRRRPHAALFLDARARSREPAAAGGGTYQCGIFGEEVVADELVRTGWRVLGHRVRTKVGELDLVVRRGDVIAFVEVKTAGPRRIDVERTVDARKRLRIRRAAVAWMTNNQRLQRGVRHYRFDVFIVHRDEEGALARVDHIEDAF